jgi:hypothetical protein
MATELMDTPSMNIMRDGARARRLRRTGLGRGRSTGGRLISRSGIRMVHRKAPM